MNEADKIVFAVLTVSDTCYKDATKDRSGPRLRELVKSNFESVDILMEILPDECPLIKQRLQQLIEQKIPRISVIFTTGGTGFAPRDVTPEATKPLLDKDCPQLTMAIALSSLQKTKFAALSRGICGIARSTLILNFPGSEKAVVECFDVVKDLLPHALQLINDDLALVRRVHAEIQGKDDGVSSTAGADNSINLSRHICPHKTGTGKDGDRNSPFPMINVDEALKILFETVHHNLELARFLKLAISPVNIPPFRASIKDGYAMKSSGFAGSKKVIGYIAAGDEEITSPFEEDECYKINTGAPVPQEADCVIQIEDTKLLKSKKNGDEDLVEILAQPKTNLDIRPIGCDLAKGDNLFPNDDHSDVVIKSLMASVGQSQTPSFKPRIGIISTGSELLAPNQPVKPGKIFDSNTTMLKSLLEQFGFESKSTQVLDDDLPTVKEQISEIFTKVDFLICSGGVSMGDKDYIKPVLEQLGFKIHFGRVNMKPGKPMTFASRGDKYFFGLPGKPVSAFVTFHLFALPAIRSASGWRRSKCELPRIPVILENKSIPLDPRPEYVRATITSRSGCFYANITGNQMSSRLPSIVGADVLVKLSGSTELKSCAVAGDTYTAYVLRHDFISNYE